MMPVCVSLVPVYVFCLVYSIRMQLTDVVVLVRVISEVIRSFYMHINN